MPRCLRSRCGEKPGQLVGDELLNRLRAVTNQRVVEDAATPGGYRLDFEPFKGWKREPPRW